MLNKFQAQTLLENFYPEAMIKAWTVYQDFYLFRVEHPDPEEKDFDPFFSVDNLTGEVRDYSILTDGNISEIMKLKWDEEGVQPVLKHYGTKRISDILTGEAF
jgi:hypothetical protein